MPHTLRRSGASLLARGVLIAAVFTVSCSLASAEEQRQQPSVSAPRQHIGPAIGIQGFAAFGVSFPVASDSFAAVGLEEQPQELGGGAQITNLWRGLFAQVAVARWTGDGSRIFIDSRGTRFDLGIPLRAKATHVDVGGGWRFQSVDRNGRQRRFVPYLGGSVGVVNYSESSRFAQAGEDVSTSTTTYAGFGGVEVRVLSWIGIAADARYRFANGIFGEDGVSARLGDDSLTGPSVSVRVLLGYFGRPRTATKRDEPAPASLPPARQASPAPTAVETGQPVEAPRPASRRPNVVTAIADTPVRIAPDPARTPLAVLRPGTRMTVVDQQPGWVKVEWDDVQWGTRVGYVEAGHVQAAEQ